MWVIKLPLYYLYLFKDQNISIAKKNKPYVTFFLCKTIYLSRVSLVLQSLFLRCVLATPPATSTATPIIRSLPPARRRHISWTPYTVIITEPTLKSEIINTIMSQVHNRVQVAKQVDYCI